MIRYDFTDQVIAITGGAGGIGAAIARGVMDAGGRVAVWDLPAALATAPEGTLAIPVDITDHAAVTAAAAQTVAELGPIAGLVNSAGIAGPTAKLWDYPLDAWSRVQRINLDGTFHACRAVVPGMIAANYGRILNIASIAGKEGNPNASAYSASKAAVIGLTKSLGKELAGHDIAVNVLTPATAKTPILDQVSPEFVAYMLSKIPRARFVELDEVVAMALWLISRENSFTTGAVFDLSGGRATY
jgi:NAD(P)-dependent dehydrogenase (short-subunit alcohol dehydrogenase family)